MCWGWRLARDYGKETPFMPDHVYQSACEIQLRLQRYKVPSYNVTIFGGMGGGEKLVQTTTSSPGASAWEARRTLGTRLFKRHIEWTISSVYSLIGIWVSKFTFLHTKLSFSWFLQSIELNFSLAHAGAVVCLSADCNLDFKTVKSTVKGARKRERVFVKRWLEIDGMYGAFSFCAKSLSFLGVTLSSRKWRACFRWRLDS